MDHIEYPKWKYQGALGKLVNSAEEEAELGDGWADQPSDAHTELEVDPRDAEIEALRQALAEAQAAVKSPAAKAKTSQQ
jgi:hypothetical protein